MAFNIESSAQSIRRLFEAGMYKEVVGALALNAKTDRASSKAAKATSLISNRINIVEEMGARIFIGELQEAEALYKSVENRLTREQKISCRFFIGVGLARVSRYPEARVIFGENL